MKALFSSFIALALVFSLNGFANEHEAATEEAPAAAEHTDAAHPTDAKVAKKATKKEAKKAAKKASKTTTTTKSTESTETAH